MSCGARALLSHRAAAALWQITVRRIREVELTLVGRDTSSRPGIRIYCVRSLHRADRRRRSGMWVTSPARTLLDLGSLLSERAFEQAVAEARARRLVSMSELHAVLARAPRRHGAAARASC